MADPTTLPVLTDDEAKALDAAIRPYGGAAPPPDASQALGSIAPMGLPQLQKPTPAQSHAAGKAEYERGLPTLTPGPDYNAQKIERGEYEAIHPWGSDISEHPGTLGKVGHVLSKIGNVAGDIVAPGTMSLIPGTDLNKRVERGAELKQFGRDVESQEKQAQTAGIEEANKEVPFTPFGQTQPIQVRQSAIPQLEAAEQRAEATTQAADTKGQTQKDLEAEKESFAKPMHDSLIKLHDAQAAVEAAKNDPNSPQYKLAAQRLQEAKQEMAQRVEALNLHEAEFGNKVQEHGLVKPSGQAQSRASAAEAVLTLMPGLAKSVRENGEQMGPLMGRLARGEIAIGNVPPDVARLYGAMKSFYALQPAVHGFRNAEFVKDFETAIGTLERDPEAFIAGMEGLKPTMEAVAKEGKTFHKRIVEGQGDQGGAPPEGAKVKTYNPATGKLE